LSWHLTWQDPVAWAVVILGVGLAWWLGRRTPKDGCASCGDEDPGGVDARVDVSETRLGRRFKE
jgi:hypothetical protein